MTETSNSSLKESISALVDGEANELELQRVLKSMDDDDFARDTWARYHLMSSATKGAEHVDLTVDLSGAIRDAIAEEERVVSRPAALNRWWSGAGKTAVAAMVTFGVVFGVQQYSLVANAPDEQATQVASTDAATNNVATTTGAVVPQGFDLPPLRARTVSTKTFAGNNSDLPRSSIRPRPQGTIVVTNEEFQQQINRLMYKHAEQVSTSGGLGVIPFARVSELGEEERE